MPQHNTDAAVYHVRTVARLVGLTPATIRAWERRYGVPAPQRGPQGYRLYSEADVRVLRWLKGQVERGLSIQQAVDLFTNLRAAGQDPTAGPVAAAVQSWQPTANQSGAMSECVVSPAKLVAQFLAACLALDEAGVHQTLRLAFAMYPLEQVLDEILRPALVEIGERWHQGRIPIAVEHFASQQVLQQLGSLLVAAPAPWQPGLVLAACAPGERHEIGLLMQVIRLRWRGWPVRYFGADLSLDRLGEVLQALRPQLLLFSAAQAQTALALLPLARLLDKLPGQPPAVIVGGPAAADPAVRRALPFECVDAASGEGFLVVEQRLHERAGVSSV